MTAPRFLRRRPFHLLALALIVAIALPSAAWWIAVRARPYPRARLDRGAAASLTVLAADGTILRQDATAAGGRADWVPLARVSPHLVAATIISEDRRFWHHGGVDPVGVARALWLDLRARRAAYGGSTLTMQLARLLEPHPRTLWGKVGETISAARLERALGKPEILEHYMNRVYYGHGAWGAEAAARFYFGKPAAALSLGEGAFLAVLPRGPTAYDPFQRLEVALRRRAHILGEMEEAGAITAAARDVAARTPLVFRREHPELRAPHFVEYVLARNPQRVPNLPRWAAAAEPPSPDASLAQRPPAERAGATVRTTLDPELQARLELAVRAHVRAMSGREISQAGLVVIRNSDGAVVAMVGSRDYFDAAHAGAVNVTTIRRRPGSTLKPFVYALALEAGDSPATIAYDVVLPGETRETYTADVKQHGFARYREALAGSYNLAAVHTLARVGAPALAARLRQAGLTTLATPDDRQPLSLAIGEAEFRILEYTGAFAAFGNGGRAVTPRVLASTAASAQAAPAAREVLTPEVAYLVFDMLSDPDARRPMFGGAAPTELGFPMALKTGTTRAYTDDLAFGTTREYTVGAWAGNFDGRPTAGVMAMQGAAPLVRSAFLAVAARYGAPTAPDRPEGLVTGTVCAVSGLRPGPDCPHKHESFIRGTEPAASCSWHRRACGHREVVFPPEVAAWARVHRLTGDHGRAGSLACPEAPAVGAPAKRASEPAIVYPADGARFLLDPARPAAQQRPPLRAMPAGAAVRWTIDGAPPDAFVPTRGTHRVRAAWADAAREIDILYD